MKKPVNPFFDIRYYHDFISPALATHLLEEATPVSGVEGLVEVGQGGGLESKASLQFLSELYVAIRDDLKAVLLQREIDRKFLDERVKACSQFNDELGRDILDSDYKTVIGLEDSKGRVVIGPLTKGYASRGGKAIAPVPSFLKGPHVTLFGPPDSAKMAVNAMNAYHRKIIGEPAIVSEILKDSSVGPMWGADDEDSKTPLRADLVDAGLNLTACFDKSIVVNDAQKKYELAKDHLAMPIKRFPGLALPCTFLFLEKSPIPLHLYDFALHLFKNWHNETSLVFYVPKLENEEEARYIHKMVSTAEKMIKNLHPKYVLGSVRLMIVLENPRAILRTHEIIDALHPYFVGASLGWHDYLASTARLFKEDHHYRIPVKADPDIVIKYIKASHLLLADVVGSRGGIKVGGMYGILPLDGDLMSSSFQMTLKGFIKDVITQLKRDLTGFWVAHPDFVRLGIALVEAWKSYQAKNKDPLIELVQSLLDKKHHKEILKCISAKDIEGLDSADPNYVRSLIVADIKESDFIANNHPDEIRFNVFQSLQYLTDWLSGNGCVALPSSINGVAVRVMDDLATAERSRWEVWHEIYHKRFALDDFLRIVHEEMLFIRKDLSNQKKIVQVKWSEKTEKWYPVAMRLMLQLMTDRKPPEFATELLLPFTVEKIREAHDPWRAVCELDPNKFVLSAYIEKFNYYFEACGCQKFASTMARLAAQDLKLAEKLVSSFTVKEINEAAAFHGNIGEGKSTLDRRAQAEQSQVLSDDESVRQNLLLLGQKYQEKFGFKFLISAKGKSSTELLAALKKRAGGKRDIEIKTAARALADIALSRMQQHRLDSLVESIEALRERHNINSVSLAINCGLGVQSFGFGEASESTWFELASLSKPLATAFAIDYFDRKGISLTTSVNALFGQTKSKFRIAADTGVEGADDVQILHLLNHTALNMHYVTGVSAQLEMPSIQNWLGEIRMLNEPGKTFKYSGGGFIVLEHLIESLEKKSIQELTKAYFSKLGLSEISFKQKSKKNIEYAPGYFDGGEKVVGGRNMFPAFAAGAMGTAKGVADFLELLTKARSGLQGCAGLTHDVGVEMLHGVYRGGYDFMGAAMGLGVFIAEAGPNRVAIHQGANEGFRALFVHVVAGPDSGKGLVILCNADNRGVLFIAEAAQVILKNLDIRGIDFDKFSSAFQYKNIEQEQIVNLGYKKLIFDAFERTLPEAIVDKGPLDPLAEYNLAVGAEIISVNDQKFARAENLLSDHLPIFDPELFGSQGKIMDSWESARHNENDFDVLVFRLTKPALINFISLSTQYHDGNHPEYVRVLGRENWSDPWVEILPKTKLQGHSLLQIKLEESLAEYSQIKVEMAPDGGLSRIGLYEDLPAKIKSQFREETAAKCIRFKGEIPKTKKPLVIPYSPSKGELAQNFKRVKGKSVDFASRAFGGIVVRATNEHYGPAAQVISPYPAINMFDGLESARSRETGHFEEVILKLGKKIAIRRIVFDFQFFVNNNPKFVSVEGFVNNKWRQLVAKTNVKAFAGNQKSFQITNRAKIDKIRVCTYPDGGVNRIRVY